MKTPLQALALCCLFTACSQSPPDPAPATPMPTAQVNAPEERGEEEEEGKKTHLAPITIEGYTIDSLYVGDMADGHFNLYLKGGDVKAVRAWVGDEAATNVVVTKAEFEEDHHCAHMEMPDPVPSDARLWVELETADKTLKASTSLTPATH